MLRDPTCLDGGLGPGVFWGGVRGRGSADPDCARLLAYPPLSSPRRRGSISPLAQGEVWIPAYAGMTPWGELVCTGRVTFGGSAGPTT
jgi:hypothetical protein